MNIPTNGDEILKQKYDLMKQMEDEKRQINCLNYQTKFDTALQKLFTKIYDKNNLRYFNSVSTKMSNIDFERFRLCESYGKSIDLLKKNGYGYYLHPTSYSKSGEEMELFACDLLENKTINVRTTHY